MMDWNEIQKRREQLAEGPVFAIPEEKVADLAVQLARRTPRSKQLFDAAKRCIPGGAQHMLVIKNPHNIGHGEVQIFADQCAIEGLFVRYPGKGRTCRVVATIVGPSRAEAKYADIVK